MPDNKEACTEFAVFRISKEKSSRIIELSKAIFAEMNAQQEVITSYQILQKTDNKEEICWHLTWINAESAKATTQKWPSFPSTKEFQSLVVENTYYGHFIDITNKS